MTDLVEQTVTKKIKLDDEKVKSDVPQCQHWVERKKRFCKMTVAKGKKLCGEHSVALDPDDNNRRVPCPLDPKHTVETFNLAKHLKKCNARSPEVLPSFISKGCNLGTPDDDGMLDESSRLQDIPQEMITQVSSIVDKLFTEFVEGNIESNLKTHKVLDDELSNESYGDDKRKHLLQTSSILGILEEADCFKSKTCFIEYGAGKAALTFWLANAIENLQDAKILVVDRASHRNKKDNLVKDRELIERVRVDIADLHLNGLSTVEKQDNFVGISKHLCGAATDLALRCIFNGNRESTKKTEKFLICVCCHHQCSWDTFIGRDWLKKNGIDRKTFNLIIKMVSWYVCGDGRNRQLQKTLEFHRENERKEKEEIGWKCKRLLDYARVQFMNDHGFDAKLCYYIDKSVTLENVCIIGKLKSS